MSTSYKELPDYKQFIKTYFVDKEALANQDVGSVLVKSTNMQSNTQSNTQSNATNGSGNQELEPGSVYGS